VLRITYLLFPMLSSRGFQALAECDCFDELPDGDGDGAKLCLMRTPYQNFIQCDDNDPTYTYYHTIGVIEVVLYGIGVPALYGGLIFACRKEIKEQRGTAPTESSAEPSPCGPGGTVASDGGSECYKSSRLLGCLRNIKWPELSSRYRLCVPKGNDKRNLAYALCFLTDAYHPHAPYYWWPLVEASRTLFLTGFLAGLKWTPIEPGTVTQVFLGLVVAFGYAIWQVYARPYVHPGNNFLAMLTSVALVLFFVAALGVQVNRAAGLAEGGGAQAPPLLNVNILVWTLLITTFVVFVVTLITFIVEIRRQASRPYLPRSSSYVSARSY